MKFCIECDNLLMPKKRKLYCRTCGRYYSLDYTTKKEYHLVKKLDRHEMDLEPIITERSSNKDYVSYEHRKAFEDFFGLTIGT